MPIIFYSFKKKLNQIMLSFLVRVLLKHEIHFNMALFSKNYNNIKMKRKEKKRADYYKDNSHNVVGL